MNLALDAMGGDFAPSTTVEGAILALNELSENIHITLVGKEDVILAKLKELNYSSDRLHIQHAETVIEMGEHPTKALQTKTDSSIAIGFGLLASGKVHAFSSAGNTGAMLVGSIFSVKPIKGVLRPAIATIYSKPKGRKGILLDVGANVDCKAEVLAQFGELGSIYAKHLLKIENPKVRLINVGEEEQKGSMILQTAYQLLKANPRINFGGNAEGRDIFTSEDHVFVCDGVVGNVVLKLAESMFDIYHEGKLGYNEVFEGLNFEATGGNPVIGVNGNVLIGHGISGPIAIKNMLLQSADLVKADVTGKLTEALIEQQISNTANE
jgi:glycerol-3-phosphate acyltransferase PlsX